MAVTEAEITDQLQQAARNRELLLYYQPIVRLCDNHIIGAEALLRWRHASEGIVPAATFLQLLQETDLILEIGCWAIREALRQIEAWRVLYGRNIIDWVSINVSPRQLGDPVALLAALRETCAAGLPVHRLKLEFTNATLQEPEMTLTVFEEIENLGIGIFIDDFEAKMSTVDLLRQPVIHAVKIKPALIPQNTNLEERKSDEDLLSILGTYSGSLIAKGVETIEERELAIRYRCDFAQGYLFGEPVEATIFGTHALTQGAGMSPVLR